MQPNRAAARPAWQAESRPSPAKICHANHSILIHIGLQQGVHRGLGGKECERFLDAVRPVPDVARIWSVPILAVELDLPGLGAAWRDLAADETYRTRHPSIARDTTIMDAISRLQRNGWRNQIILLGQQAHVSIYRSALDLSMADFEVFVVEDGMASDKLTHKLNALDRIRDCGCAVVTNTESVMSEWTDHLAPWLDTDRNALLRGVGRAR